MCKFGCSKNKVKPSPEIKGGEMVVVVQPRLVWLEEIVVVDRPNKKEEMIG